MGTKVLKDNLSKYLRMVRDGETVLVTDRDEVIAEIRQPTHPYPGRVSRWEAFLNDEARRGSVSRAKRGNAPPLSKLLKVTRPSARIDLQKLMDFLKGD